MGLSKQSKPGRSCGSSSSSSKRRSFSSPIKSNNGGGDSGLVKKKGRAGFGGGGPKRRRWASQLIFRNHHTKTAASQKTRTQRQLLLLLVVMIHHMEKQQLSIVLPGLGLQQYISPTSTTTTPTTHKSAPKEFFGKATTEVRTSLQQAMVMVPSGHMERTRESKFQASQQHRTTLYTWMDPPATSTVTSSLEGNNTSTFKRIVSKPRSLQQRRVRRSDPENNASTTTTTTLGVVLHEGAIQLATDVAATTRSMTNATAMLVVDTTRVAQRQTAAFAKTVASLNRQVLTTTHVQTKWVLNELIDVSKNVLDIHFRLADAAVSIMVSTGRALNNRLPTQSPVMLGMPHLNHLPLPQGAPQRKLAVPRMVSQPTDLISGSDEQSRRNKKKNSTTKQQQQQQQQQQQADAGWNSIPKWPLLAVPQSSTSISSGMPGLESFPQHSQRRLHAPVSMDIETPYMDSLSKSYRQTWWDRANQHSSGVKHKALHAWKILVDKNPLLVKQQEIPLKQWQRLWQQAKKQLVGPEESTTTAALPTYPSKSSRRRKSKFLEWTHSIQEATLTQQYSVTASSSSATTSAAADN